MLSKLVVEALLSVAQITEDNFCLRQEDRVPPLSFLRASCSLDGITADERFDCGGLPNPPSSIEIYKKEQKL